MNVSVSADNIVKTLLRALDDDYAMSILKVKKSFRIIPAKLPR